MKSLPYTAALILSQTRYPLGHMFVCNCVRKILSLKSHQMGRYAQLKIKGCCFVHLKQKLLFPSTAL